jgi:hypothetical protein
MASRPVTRLKRPAPQAKCRRQLRLNPAGIPVLCRRNAALQLGGVDLCQEHAWEAMQAAEQAPVPVT